MEKESKISMEQAQKELNELDSTTMHHEDREKNKKSIFDKVKGLCSAMMHDNTKLV